jgi:hypothetical protein
MMWVIRYLAKNTSVKNLDHQRMVIERIENGAKTSKQPYGFNWSIRE